MSELPAIYEGWLTEALPGPVGGEPRSTCSACPACHAGVFKPQVKCCGYLPRLPNYLVGRGLREGGLGAATLRARMDAKVAVSPLGLGCPPDYAADWELTQRTTGFGTNPDLICTHYDDGRCAIWANRDAVCTTWFCQIDGGESGREFWSALRGTLQTLERSLSRWVLRELGLEPGTGSWERFVYDREGLYLACADRVEALSWADVRQIGDFELRVRMRETRRAWVARAAERDADAGQDS